MAIGLLKAGVKGDPLNSTGKDVADTVNVLYGATLNVKSFGAVGDGITDDTVALQAAADSGKAIFFPSGTYLISSTVIYPIGSKAVIIGNNVNDTIMQAASGFTGYMFRFDGSYDVQNVRFNGLSGVAGVYGIGSNTPTASGGGARLEKVTFFYFDECVRFGGEYEHPLGLSYNDVYCQQFINAGINLGGLSGAADSGESNFVFGRITVTNPTSPSTEYPSSVAANTPSATFDRITWTGTAPTYGFVVMRSANGSTGWHVPPNWSTIIGFTANTFDAQKVGGETWFYRVVRNTVGLLVRRAKSISMGSIQCEYVGVGQYYAEVRGCDIGSIYYENRDVVPPRPAVCAVGLSQSVGVVVNGGWVEGCSYGVLTSSNSSLKYDMVQHSAVTYAAIGKVNTGAAGRTSTALAAGAPAIMRSVQSSAFDHNDVVTIYTADEFSSYLDHVTSVRYALRYRGADRSVWSHNNTTGTTFSGLNNVDIRPFSKTVIESPVKAGTLFTDLTNNTATKFLEFNAVNTTAHSTRISYVIESFASGACRQSIGGELIITTCNASGTVVATLAGNFAKAQQAGTITDPVFTATVSGTTVSILVSVNSSNGTTIRLRMTPLTTVSSTMPTAFIQS